MTKTQTIPLIHRDVSWLSFNYRVLQESMDKSVPLFERLKFLAIYSNNLNEFFRVRVAQHRNLIRVGKKTQKEIHYDPKKMIMTIMDIVNKQQERFSEIFEKEIIPELKTHGIRLLRRLDLNTEQREFVENYFKEFMLPFVQPVLLNKDKIRPFLNNAALYLALLIRDKEVEGNNGNEEFAIVKIPSDHLPRFIEIPAKSGHSLIMLDDVVRHSVSLMFPGYDILDTYSIKLTRDAELYIDDEFSGNLIAKIKKSLKKRHVGPASRFVYDREMPQQLLDFLIESFELEKYDVFREGRYHNNFDFFSFPDYGMNNLKYVPLPPMKYPLLEDSDDFFKAIRTKDHLLNYPYHSYESVVRFFENAANDPDVTHLMITQYRVAKTSRIMDALIKAAKTGKQVFAFIEVKARFDEEANLHWGEKLEKNGIQVRYSFPGVKVHAKMALIRRQEGPRHKLYAYMSTGNFHETTAKIYSDFGFFTTDKRITAEVARLFTFLRTVELPSKPFKHLLVGQFEFRERFEALIDKEIANARAGKRASIIIKSNSIQDEKMIEKLYEASNAGVKIKMIIRGICCIVAGVPGYSENIEIISIVDRFLEHARVFIFHNNGNEKIYLSSADWMNRNLKRRIETVFPIYNKALKREIKDYIKIQLNDNVKARVLDEKQCNEYKKDDSDMPIRTQYETYYYIKRLEEKRMLED